MGNILRATSGGKCQNEAFSLYYRPQLSVYLSGILVSLRIAFLRWTDGCVFIATVRPSSSTAATLGIQFEICGSHTCDYGE